MIIRELCNSCTKFPLQRAISNRIKGYGYRRPGSSREKKFYARYVRGNAYGQNDFIDNGDGTVRGVIPKLEGQPQKAPKGI